MLTQREYRKRHRNQSAPDKKTIHALSNRFEQYGTTLDSHHLGRPRTARSEENIARVRECVAESPKTLTRRRAQELNISQRSLQRILKKDLHLFLYKIQLVQKLLPRDNNQRLKYSNVILNIAREVDNFSEKMIKTKHIFILVAMSINKILDSGELKAHKSFIKHCIQKK